ncbi:MAG: hypothetical protein ABIZ04_25425 [Opitutus sp.]
MNISGNIIRFPHQTASSVRRDHSEQEPAKIVSFPPPDLSALPSDLQERGQVFAAHRIVSRVADQLDSIVAL